MHLARAAHWGHRHPVIIKITIEMRVGWYSWCCVWLLQQIEWDFGLWEQSVPQWPWEIIQDARRQNTGKMLFECFDGDFGDVLSVTAEGYEFKFASVPNELIHFLRTLVVAITCFFVSTLASLHQPFQQRLVCFDHFVIRPIFHWLNGNVVWVNLDHHHDVHIGFQTGLVLGILLFGQSKLYLILYVARNT